MEVSVTVPPTGRGLKMAPNTDPLTHPFIHASGSPPAFLGLRGETRSGGLSPPRPVYAPLRPSRSSLPPPAHPLRRLGTLLSAAAPPRPATDAGEDSRRQSSGNRAN